MPIDTQRILSVIGDNDSEKPNSINTGRILSIISQAEKLSPYEAMEKPSRQRSPSETLDIINQMEPSNDDILGDLYGIMEEEGLAGSTVGGVAKAFGRGAAEGITTELPSMVGRAIEFVTPDAIKQTLGDPGKSLADWADQKAVDWYGEQPEHMGEVERVVYEGTKMLAPSVVPAGLIGTGSRVLLGIGNTMKAARAAELAGDAIRATELMSEATKAARMANTVASAGTAGIFGFSQAQQTVDTANERADMLEREGKFDEAAQMRESAHGIAPWITGGIEAAGEYLGTKYLGKLFGLDEAEIVKRGAGNLIKDFLKTLGVEVGTEVGQQYGEAAVEKYTAIRPEAEPLKEALDVIGPTAFMTLLTGGMGAGYQKALGIGQQDRTNDQIVADDHADQDRILNVEIDTGAQELLKQAEDVDPLDILTGKEGDIFEPTGREAPTATTPRGEGDEEMLADLKAVMEEAPTDTGDILADLRAIMERAPEEAVKAGRPITEVPHSTGKETKTYLSDNTEIDTEYAVVSADDLIASHDDSIVENPEFPKQLQPRDRTRKAMRLQIENIANNLVPERLGESSSVTTGAPIVGEDLIVESGNGRTIAIRKAYEKNTRYKDWLLKNAEKFGLIEDDVENIEKPVLVRVRKSDVNRLEFVKRSNLGEVARMSPTETAKSDADRLDNADLSIFQPSDEGAISASSNTAFINRFIKKLGTNEAAGYVTEDGRYTKQLIDRVQAAVFHKSYNDDHLLTLQAEEADPNIKNILNALTIAAPEFVKARAVESNLGNTDIIPHIVGSVKIIQKARSQGVPVQDFFNQISLFGKVPELTQKIALFIDQNKRSGKKMGQMFKYAASSIRESLIDQKNLGLPGFKKGVINSDEIIDNAIQKMEAQYEEKQRGLFGGSVQEGGPEGKRGLPGRSAYGVAGTQEKSEEAQLEDSFNQVKQYEIKEPTADQKQLKLNFKPPKEKPAKGDTVSGKLPHPAQRVRMATTGRISASGNTVRNIEQAASLLAHIRKSAQELFYSVAVDGNGNILEIHRYSKGRKSEAALDFGEVVGRIFNVDGVKKVYLAHNHPSGDILPSTEDSASMEKAAGLLRLKDIDTEALVITDQQYSDITPGKFFKSARIKPSLRKTLVPEKERAIQKLAPAGKIANNSAKIRELVKSKYGNRSGFVFLTPKLQEIGFMPFEKGQRTKDFAAKVIAKGEELNAVGMAYHSNEPLVTVVDKPVIEERRKTLRQLRTATQGYLQLFDIVDPSYSMADSGLLPSNENVMKVMEAINKLNTEKPLYQIGKSIPIVGNEPLLDLLRKAPPLAGATMGLTPNNEVWVRGKDGQGFTVKSVNFIEPNKAAVELGYGQMLQDGEFIRGKSEGETVELQRDTADEWTASHETLHQLRRMNLIPNNDATILSNHAKRQRRLGKWDHKATPGSEEDWVAYATAWMKDRSEIKGLAGRALKRIADLIDSLINIFKRTAKGILREIESGKTWERAAKTPDNQPFAAMENAARDTKYSKGNVSEHFEQARRVIKDQLESSPEVNESVEKIKEASGSGEQIHKEAGGLFKYASDRFGKGFIDTDMKWYDRAMGMPYWLGKKYRSMKNAVNIEIEAAETRSTELFHDYDGDLGRIQETIPKNKKHMQTLRNLIWKWDGQRFPEKEVPSNWHKEIKEGLDIEVNPEHYAEARAFLEKDGVSSEVIDAFLVIRKKLDEKFIDADRTLRSENMDPTTIEEYRSLINLIHNYFPHRRTGNAHVTIIDQTTGATVYREHYNTLHDRALPIDKKARARANTWLNGAIGKGQLSEEKSRFKIFIGPVKRMPDEAFFQIPVQGMQQVVAQAGRHLEEARADYEAERLYNKEGRSKNEAMDIARKRMRADMESALSKAVAEVFKARGWAAHTIARKGVPGHETQDIFGILFDYLSGYAGFKTKISRAKAHHGNLVEIDAKQHPNEYKHLSKYAKDMLENQDRTDKAVDSLRGLFFVKYLGFVPKSGLVNLTQNIVMAAPILSQHTTGGILKSERTLGKAMVDVRKALTSKAAWTGKKINYTRLSENEQRALNELIESGASQDLFLRELKGNMPGIGWGKYFRKFVDKSGIFMQLAEKFNRASTGLAAYRVAVKEKGMSHDDAVQFAKEIIYDSHFLYGKANLPAAFRGGDFQKVARAAYTFRSFTHNYLSAMAHLFKSQGPAGKKAFARSMRNLFLMGGLTAIPFFKAASEAILWALGDDDEDVLTRTRELIPSTWLKDMIVYGLPGAAGVDLTGSLSIEVPKTWEDLIGVPWAAVEDTVNTIESLKSGANFRALSETPFTPTSVRNAMRGLELYSEGQRTRSGKAINFYGQEGPRKITGTEAVLKSLAGLQPVSVSKGYAAYRATRKMQKALQERKSKWASRFVNAMIRHNFAEMEKVKAEVREWNDKARQEGKNHKIIDIRRSVKYRLKSGSTNMPKVMRKRAREIAGEWGG